MQLSLFTYAFLLPATALAFSPAVGKPAMTSTALRAASFEDEQGAIDPVGFFDPFGLTLGITDAKFAQYRAGEVKNGRAAMLAVIGYIVPEFARFPGEISPGLAFADVPNGVAAINVIPSTFWITLFFFIGASDFLNSDESGFIETLPIDLDPEEMEERRMNEISNGRLAMLAFWELVRHDIVKGSDGLGDHLIAGMPFLYHN